MLFISEISRGSRTLTGEHKLNVRPPKNNCNKSGRARRIEIKAAVYIYGACTAALVVFVLRGVLYVCMRVSSYVAGLLPTYGGEFNRVYRLGLPGFTVLDR